MGDGGGGHGCLRHRVYIDRYVLAYAEYEVAGVFDAPLHVGNSKVGLDGETVRSGLHGHVHLHRVVLPVQVKDSVDNKVAVNRFAEIAFDMVGAECDQLISIALEDAFVHPMITRGVAALPAGCVDLDQAARCSRERVAANGPLLELECAVHGVQGIAERPLDGGSRRIERDVDGVWCLSSGRSDEEQQDTGQKKDSDLADTLAYLLHERPLIA